MGGQSFHFISSDQEYVFNDTFNGRGYFKNKGGLQIALQSQFFANFAPRFGTL